MRLGRGLVLELEEGRFESLSLCSYCIRSDWMCVE